jgi:hypothetical protein
VFTPLKKRSRGSRKNTVIGCVILGISDSDTNVQPLDFMLAVNDDLPHLKIG